VDLIKVPIVGPIRPYSRLRRAPAHPELGNLGSKTIRASATRVLPGNASGDRFVRRRVSSSVPLALIVWSGLAFRTIFDLGLSYATSDQRATAVADLGTSLSGRKKIVDNLSELARPQRMQTGESCKNQGTHELRYGQGRVEVTKLPPRLGAIEQILEGLSISMDYLGPQRLHGVAVDADQVVSFDSDRVTAV
jgi:hypothetical protein